MTTFTIPAGLMFALGDAGVEFDLHSGRDSMSLRGTAVVTVDDGAIVRIEWVPGDLTEG